MPGSWSAHLERELPLYRRLPQALRDRLHGLLHVFLAEKHFVGCNGVTVSEAMRVVIAAHACTLVLNRARIPAQALYPQLRSILVYPAEFVVHEADEDEHGLVTTGHRVLSGQAWDASRIILSWADVTDTGDGYNVVLHEFAHYLDAEDGVTDLAFAAAAGTNDFARDLRAVFERVQADVDAHRETFLDPYAATDPAEFFAVATEAFFDLPQELAAHEPVLYACLRQYYGLDPAAWSSTSA